MTQYELDNIYNGARKHIKETDPLLPTFFIGSPAGMVVVGAQFNTESDKNNVSRMIRRMAQEANATYVVFMSETWQLRVDSLEEQEAVLKKYGRVANCPNAKEVLMITLETFNGVKTGLADILPGRELAPIKWDDSMQMHGRFSHFLGLSEVKP